MVRYIDWAWEKLFGPHTLDPKWIRYSELRVRKSKHWWYWNCHLYSPLGVNVFGLSIVSYIYLVSASTVALWYIGSQICRALHRFFEALISGCSTATWTINIRNNGWVEYSLNEAIAIKFRDVPSSNLFGISFCW